MESCRKVRLASLVESRQRLPFVFVLTQLPNICMGRNGNNCAKRIGTMLYNLVENMIEQDLTSLIRFNLSWYVSSGPSNERGLAWGLVELKANQRGMIRSLMYAVAKGCSRNGRDKLSVCLSQRQNGVMWSIAGNEEGCAIQKSKKELPLAVCLPFSKTEGHEKGCARSMSCELKTIQKTHNHVRVHTVSSLASPPFALSPPAVVVVVVVVILDGGCHNRQTCRTMATRHAIEVYMSTSLSSIVKKGMRNTNPLSFVHFIQLITTTVVMHK